MNARGNWQLRMHTLRVEKKPLLFHNRRKLASRLSGEGGGGEDRRPCLKHICHGLMDVP